MPYTCDHCGELREQDKTLCVNCGSSKYSYTASNRPDSFMQSEYARMVNLEIDDDDTSFCSEGICPYCAKIIDTTDVVESMEIECEHCLNRVSFEVEFDPIYTTRKVE